jgi:protein-S-isoprenylcysteine O-methyltransferase Ste14
MSNSIAQDRARLDRDGVREIVRGTLRYFAHLTILALAAGSAGWTNAWVYTGLHLFLQAAYVVTILRFDPRLLNERGKFIQQDTKAFDKVFYALYAPLTLVVLVVAGLDAVRWEWSSMPGGLAILGVVVSVPTFFFALWAMVVNPHFETTVRLQEAHQVCTSGPYRFVRHPGYVSLILFALLNPLILGSWWAFVPGGVMALLAVTRTALEDRTLQEELPGYRAYTQVTRYRLLPWAW